MLMGRGKYGLQEANTYYHNQAMPPNVALDVYICNPMFSYDPANIPGPRGNWMPILNEFVTFTTEHKIDFGEPEYKAPNDWYSFTVFTFVIERDTNISAPIYAPITYFGLANSGAGDFSVKSEPDGVPSSSLFTPDVSPGPGILVDSYTLYPTIRRSKRGKALTFFMFATNWMMALCSMITTSIIFDRGSEVKDGVALLPITVILVIPAIRNLYPGAPPFGIFLDVVGFFPQMFIVAVCTVMVLWICSRRSVGGKGVITHA
ncbi:hypothetical protein BJ322DRAFT_568509 [Thelephora terrestris]|uniref:Uncharacterized protein n=1 Tax=Thelephora terrestris TaxID=56493 RepID=A0A9P6H1V0_9AGAM|nr:hypothetical protein BJ322DRAFT_568509 [Thelephora terrestris]